MSAPNSKKPIHDLAKKHLDAQAVGLHWTEIWEIFLMDPWFTRRLDSSAGYVLQRFGVSMTGKDDVKQEAMLQFARSLERNVSLGFDSSRGEYGPYLATIINRCCQKGLRQFRRSNLLRIENESQHPVYEYTSEHDEQLDLEASIESIPEPYRETIRLTCDGLSIAQIAQLKRRSPRTIYRWLEKGIESLRRKLTDQNHK